MEAIIKDFLTGLEDWVKHRVSLAIEHAINDTKQLHTTEAVYLTRKEAAAYLKISLPTLDKAVELGVLESYRMMGNIRFLQSDLNRVFNVRKFK